MFKGKKYINTCTMSSRVMAVFTIFFLLVFTIIGSFNLLFLFQLIYFIILNFVQYFRAAKVGNISTKKFSKFQHY